MRFFADPQGEWAKAAKVDWDATSIMGNRRSKRFVAVVNVSRIWLLLIQDGAVSAVFIEPDNAGLTITSADAVLGAIS